MVNDLDVMSATNALRGLLVELDAGETIMKRYVRLLSDRQTTVITCPRLDFNSMQEENLSRLTRFFRHAADRVIGQKVILDTTSVESGGSRFLTAVHRLATDLAQKQVQLVIAGDPGGLFRLAGWNRRFRLYHDLLAAMLSLSDRLSAKDLEREFDGRPRVTAGSGKTPVALDSAVPWRTHIAHGN
jgi:hypothetical protein